MVDIFFEFRFTKIRYLRIGLPGFTCLWFFLYHLIMDVKELDYFYNKFKYGEDNFHNLMQYRVRKILLISTFYDAYIFEHDSKLADQIVGEYHQLNLTTVPRMVSAPTGKEALRKLEGEHFDLVITTMRIGEISPFELADKVKEISPDTAVLLLLTGKTDINLVNRNQHRMENIENVFLWNGNSRLFLAMIKYIEDKRNVLYDTEKGFVRVILLVEDSITFSSMYLPLLYTEIMEQTQRLIAQELNDNTKYHRMRTRPKVLLARTYEEAVETTNRFKDYLLGIISDVEFTHGGEIDREAGFNLLKTLREEGNDVPVLLQSSDRTKRETAERLKVQFLYKRAPTLLAELRHFILSNLGFGDFVFKDEGGQEISRAHTLKDFESIFPTVPIKSLLFHASNDHFSGWLTAHGEFQVARRIKPVKVSDFGNPEDMRIFLTDIFKEVREQRNRGKIVDFDESVLQQENVIVRIGSGSLGGKGRGLAFFNTLLVTTEIAKKYGDIRIQIPRSSIIGTQEFDLFMQENDLENIHHRASDEEIKKVFLQGQLSEQVMDQLIIYLKHITGPLAVRSSGLLEDSQSQPFAGVYETYMVPNNSPDFNTRLRQVCDAIKLVYASVFLENAVSYIETLNYGIEEEKMAVIIQELVGNRYDDIFYPHFAGVAQSHNYYPISHMEHADGVVMLAAGLGQSVVRGGREYMFCPKYPEITYGAVKDLLRSSQTHFFALDMTKDNCDLSRGEDVTLRNPRISVAEKQGTLRHLASVWDNDNDRILDGLSNPGPRIVNFANILKYEYFPLAKVLQDILTLSEIALGIPVEIEFAVDLTKNPREGIVPTFYLLQVRPLSVNPEEASIDLDGMEPGDLLLYSREALGNGLVEDIHDILYLDPHRFDNTKTHEIQQEVAEFNKRLKETTGGYILIGPGRWGTRDRFLGVPVTWGQINRSRIIVETGLEDFDIEPSQGSHFFHNLVAMNVGYLNIPFHNAETAFIDWKWLKEQEVVDEGTYFRHIRTKTPLKVQMDGKHSEAVVYKNEGCRGKAVGV